jgi:hypothetical protein
MAERWLLRHALSAKLACNPPLASIARMKARVKHSLSGSDPCGTVCCSLHENAPNG